MVSSNKYLRKEASCLIIKYLCTGYGENPKKLTLCSEGGRPYYEQVMVKVAWEAVVGQEVVESLSNLRLRLDKGKQQNGPKLDCSVLVSD